MPFDRRREISRLSLKIDQLGQGQYFDVDIAGALHQLGRNDAGGAVAGRKGLVQVRHHAADSRIALNQVDLKAGVGQVQGGLNTGDAAALHQYRANLFIVVFSIFD